MLFLVFIYIDIIYLRSFFFFRFMQLVTLDLNFLHRLTACNLILHWLYARKCILTLVWICARTITILFTFIRSCIACLILNCSFWTNRVNQVKSVLTYLLVYLLLLLLLLLLRLLMLLLLLLLLRLLLLQLLLLLLLLLRLEQLLLLLVQKDFEHWNLLLIILFKLVVWILHFQYFVVGI